MISSRGVPLSLAQNIGDVSSGKKFSTSPHFVLRGFHRDGEVIEFSAFRAGPQIARCFTYQHSLQS